MSAVPRPRLVLASTSRYRRALLERLRVPFECVAPQVDETALQDEAPGALAARLARLKAEAVAAGRPGAVVIGSDQVAVRGSEALGKPGSFERCVEQLVQSSGREVEFLTAVFVLDAAGGRSEAFVDRTVVRFRSLARAEIERYVAADSPLDCAGGSRPSRSASHFRRIESADPTGLPGLPLIWLCGALRRAGIPVP